MRISRVTPGLPAVVLIAVLATVSAPGAPARAGTDQPGRPTVPPLEQPSGQGRCAPRSNTVHPGVTWAQQRLAPHRVWPLTRGAGQVVAVVDSGVDGQVPQLAGRVLPGKDIVSGQGRADTDCFGHGTFVAGVIAAGQAEGTGVVGVAPAAVILPLRQTNGTDGSAASMAAAIRAAVDAGARVVNLSVTSAHPTAELEAAVGYASQRDVLLVAAAGNDAENGNPRSYPAAYPDVLAVSAIAEDGSRGRFSGVGDFVDLAAPGVDVIGLSAAGTGHVSAQGTSFATPFVAGTAALVRAYHPKLTARQVKHRLEATADRPGRDVPDPQVGYGVVNPLTAVTAVLPEESSGPRRADGQPVVVPPPVWPHTDNSGRLVAAVVALGAVGLAGLAWALRSLVPRARRRNWRAAERVESP
ncbi:type VII secretion-associated serine protease mycosin [Streptoalloteichus hindustanus]|uniref:Type VII secretion-associated serine protease mycosin n=1 Tax=Streptoalloteichus hindustanus TaxID=2017 RepID=A0A1M5PVE5_STRHI|nr:type VII secretion-associated serine protease mycosin [Streptoalloteichus hindustanus]SHH05794.1 type VII secretion-associated serine protease mycosin [Streptoalloteichus hindustanus]